MPEQKASVFSYREKVIAEAKTTFNSSQRRKVVPSLGSIVLLLLLHLQNVHLRNHREIDAGEQFSKNVPNLT